MAETESPYSLEALKSFFMPGDTNDPRINPDLRKRIALAMMARQRKAPQNIGEGIYAVGEAIGDVRQRRALEEQDIAQTEKLKGLTSDVIGGDGAAPAVAAGPGAVSGAMLPPIVAADTATETPASPAITQPPPPMTRSAGTPSPLPPDAVGPMAQPAPPQLITAAGTNTIAPPPGALPPSSRQEPMTDPRVREAVARTLAARGGPPPNPPGAGGQLPAQMPLAPPTGGPSPAPRGLGGNPLDANAQMAALPPTTAGQGIRPAPPPSMVRPEPQGEPAPPGLVPLTPVQQRAILTARQHPQDADVQRVMKQLYDQEEVKRTYQQGILNKQYEHKLKMADPQYQATLEKTRQEARKAAEPELREDVEGKTYYDPAIGGYRAARVEGTDTAARPTFKPSTEFQGKTFANYGRTRLAHETLTPELEKILVTSRGQAAMGALGLRTWQSEQYKEADTARENYVQALIRQLSGAGYGIQEAEAEARSMMPKYNDQPRVLEQKRAQRAQFIGGLESIIGPRGKKAAEWQMEQERAPALAKQKAINEQMADVVPTHKGQEKVMRDARGNIVARRVWDGQNWREL